MKVFDKKREFIYLMIIFFLGYNIVLNFYFKNFLKSNNINLNYLFAVSFIPDRIILINFKYDDIKCRFLTIDLFLKNIIGKKYDKILQGITFDFLTFKIQYKKKNVEKKEENKGKKFILPFIQNVNIRFSNIVFLDDVNNKKLEIKNISGKSVLNKSRIKEEEYIFLNCNGIFNGKKSEKVYLKLYFFPYFQNKFIINLFGSKLSIKEFQPIFLENNIIIEDGKLNFIIQLKGEENKIYINNIMQFEKLTLKENTDIDIKELFGLSVKQLVDFLKNSKGDFYVNFDYDVELKDADKILKIYTEKFTESIENKVILGVVTAPARQIKDLIWNLTGENIFRIIKIFGGE